MGGPCTVHKTHKTIFVHLSIGIRMIHMCIMYLSLSIYIYATTPKKTNKLLCLKGFAYARSAGVLGGYHVYIHTYMYIYIYINICIYIYIYINVPSGT